MSRSWLTLAAACLALLLGGCGFHLRGSYLLPAGMNSLYLSTPKPYHQLGQRISELLRSNAIRLLTAPDEEQPTLEIIQDQLERRTLSVFFNGQVAEYELIYQVNYRVSLPGQDARDFQVTIYRDYQDDPNQVLAKSRELDLMLDEMRGEAADRIIRQLASLDY